MSSIDHLHASDVLRHGAYVSVGIPRGARGALAAAPVPAIAKRLGLENEFTARDGHPRDAIAFLRRVEVTAGDVRDHGLMEADALVHVASATSAVVDEFCAAFSQLLGPAAMPVVLRGVVRPMRYTGGAMHEFAYARQVAQQPGPAMPHAFLLPMRKTEAWWAKGWMERHTYFLPRFDERGRMVTQGHALAAAAGIPSLMRRTYRNIVEPAPDGAYDFVNYFECADADVQTFHSVCASLRDVARNPEWEFVREGPTWHGRRTATWQELFESGRAAEGEARVAR